ncbi:hypothetical protein [Actinomadura madurae]|uniref:hypothetical protein n=1 Tax=Actinomadura madurae TaxID=1993 RepID=UPI002025DDE9|nr:hypothetical protein [Actinomadura madurae]MCQ0014670.1 hypothetical protein [Actinomadura madurae]URN05528.1 hypothetical protein LUW74_20895 [Actinomadura madurae]
MGIAVLAVVLQHGAGGARGPEALAVGYDHAFWWSVAFTLAALPLCLVLPGRAEPPSIVR